MHYIYAIQHNKTKKMYIGCSKNAEQRYIQHMTALKRGEHTSKEMQEDFDRFGEDYSLYILEKVENGNDRVEDPDYSFGSISRKTMYEVKWMRKYNTVGSGYNTQDAVARRVLRKPFYDIPLKDGLPN